MQPVLPQYEPDDTDPSELSKIQRSKLRRRKSNSELLIDLLTSVRFWGGLSVLVALVSLALPWWGVTVGPSIGTSSWGLFFGPQSQQMNVVFFQDRLDSSLSGNYSFMTALLLLTALATITGAVLKRGTILTAALTLSIITVLSFLGDVASAVNSECESTLVLGGSCISGLVGQGTSGLNIVTWGFQSGFYIFTASTILLFVTLAIQLGKPPAEWPLSGVK